MIDNIEFTGFNNPYDLKIESGNNIVNFIFKIKNSLIKLTCQDMENHAHKELFIDDLMSFIDNVTRNQNTILNFKNNDSLIFKEKKMKILKNNISYEIDDYNLIINQINKSIINTSFYQNNIHLYLDYSLDF